MIFVTRRLTRRKLLQFVIAATFMWAYTIAVGGDPSVARAALMFTLVVFAPVVWRRTNSLNVIGGAGAGAACLAARESLRSIVSVDFSFGAGNCPARRSGHAENAARWFLEADARDALSTGGPRLVPGPFRSAVLE